MKLSIVICCYSMARELPRTLRSLAPGAQRGIGPEDYEIIVIDNGSPEPMSEAVVHAAAANARLIRLDEARPSPCVAMNWGLREARAPLIGAMIDGARMASPGLAAGAIKASRLARRPLVLTLGFHLGPKMQMDSVAEGYDRAAEDALLASVDWERDGYRLFDISVLAGSSKNGWFQPINESNALFTTTDLWDELGGFDEAFESPGGGCVNLDLLVRAVSLPRVQAITLLGEGTFHQVHGGVATNAPRVANRPFFEEYERIRGYPFRTPSYESLYIGNIPPRIPGAPCQ